MLRKTVLVAGVLACLSLTACGEKPAEQAAPVAEKFFGREAPLYAGQEKLESIQSGTIEAGPGGGVILKASGMTAGAGWTQAGFLPRVYAGKAPDGIYEVDVVAQKPTTPGAATLTSVEVNGDWSKFTDGRVNAARCLSAARQIGPAAPGLVKSTSQAWRRFHRPRLSPPSAGRRRSSARP